jgi:hypothetical protein
MSAAENYRRYAADCARLAQSVSAPEDRARMMEMAALWLRVAESVEAVEKYKPPCLDE